jgi:hypothetical protein
MEPAKGIEPPTSGLRNRCSTPELRWHTSIIYKTQSNEQRFSQNHQIHLNTETDHRFSVEQAIEGYLLSCKVEGKSPATIKAYISKLCPFLWYVNHYNLPWNVAQITTQHIREFLIYLFYIEFLIVFPY